MRTIDGRLLMVPISETQPVQQPQQPPPVRHTQHAAPDYLSNYSNLLCHWFLQLLNMDDTAKEGDPDRLIINCKQNLPMFFSHSARSNYFVECLDFIMKVEKLLSPSTRLRVLEGCFVNPKGGKGNNREADLAQEHSVRNRKDLTRQLGANKTDKAIKRVTNAADSIAAMGHSLDQALHVARSGGRHTKRTSEADNLKIAQELANVKPFITRPGRTCEGYPSVTSSPYSKIDKQAMDAHMKRCIQRIKQGSCIEAGEEEDNPADYDEIIYDEDDEVNDE